MSSVMSGKDIEAASAKSLSNHSVHSFAWSNLGVTVNDRKTKRPLTILDQSFGYVAAGQLLALMGPSGSGKTTLLNVLADRSQASWDGHISMNGEAVNKKRLREVSGFVEQEDALIGSLTVKETINFSARLALHGVNSIMRNSIVDSLISSFGLQAQADTIIGTPLRKGISGGQKRRVSVASQLVTSPAVVFLDEPTSGLDSTASYEVIKFIADVAKQRHLLVIMSIHQPSTSTFELFDGVTLLSKGKTCYSGSMANLRPYFQTFSPIPIHTNPAEYLLDLVNTDFASTAVRNSTVSLDQIWFNWQQSTLNSSLQAQCTEVTQREHTQVTSLPQSSRRGLRTSTPFILLHRNFIKSYRDFLAYGTRVAMYSGLAIMMGTVWLRLDYTQTSIQPFINALFFGGAFMSFMAVAYVPSIIEDIQLLRKEHANGLYGPFSFMIANFLIGLPWLLIITLIFSVITYFLSNFRLAADGFWFWVLWLFLDLLAAESLVVLLSAIFPIFVVALAATAFANGLWMSVGGFLVPTTTLNVFWKYVFHYIDYQAYVFQAMMVNQFKKTTYDCETLEGGQYYCMYPSDLQDQGKIRGTAVLHTFRYSTETGKLWEWFGIMLAIIVVYRILGYTALWVRTRTA